MQAGSHFAKQYRTLSVVVFSLALVIVLVRLASHALLSQMQAPPFLFPEGDFVYKLALHSPLVKFLIANKAAALAFDFLLLATPVLFVFTQHRLFVILFTLLATTYFLINNMVAGHHYHALIGLFFIPLPFWSKDPVRFNFLWQGMRYYFLYLFGSAAVWKICRGSAFYADQLPNILKPQQLDLLLQQPGSLRAGIASYFISHPQAAHMVLGVNTLLQLSFLIGFFTRRFDAALLVLAILFVVGNYFIMNIVSVEVLILGVTLFNPETLTARLQLLFAKRDTPKAA